MAIRITNNNYGGRVSISSRGLGGRFQYAADPVDADAQVFFNRVTSAGGTLSATEQSAITTLVTSLKSAGIWTLMKAIYPMVGSSAAACAQNLKSSSYTGTFSSGWTFASTGVTPNGTNAFMNTGLNISTELIQSNSHASFYSRTANDITGYPTPLGAYGNISYTQAIEVFIKRPTPGDKGGGAIGDFNLSIIDIAETDARKFAIISRTSATSLKYYTTGILRATNTSNDTTSFGSVLAYIGAANLSTGTAVNYSQLECAFASIGNGLTDIQASDFYTAVQTFQTTLGRQV